VDSETYFYRFVACKVLSFLYLGLALASLRFRLCHLLSLSFKLMVNKRANHDIGP